MSAVRRCWVYRGRKQPDAYLYVTAADDFSRVPAALLERLGPLELALTFDLTPERRLARVDTGAVLEALGDRGYFLQLPPPKAPPAGGGR